MEAYLPPVPGGWFDVTTGMHHAGGATVTVATPLDRLPLFARAGSMLPLQPVVQHTGERPEGPLTLHVYAAPGPFESTLYDDAGDGWGCDDGDYWLGTFRGEADDHGLRLSTHVGGRFAPPWSEWAFVVHGLPQRPASVRVNNASVSFAFEDGTARFAAPAGASFVIEF
jgi:alpha-glucosidase